MRNVAKLLFINMLGHDTDFGQLECLKLITSNTFAEKRIGYLGLTQLFNEKSEILMMATNRMRIDLTSNNNYVVALALSSLSEICTADMCRELASEVAKLFSTSTNYVKKKAALAATRIIRKVPETIDLFEDKVESLLEERHHGVLLAALSLIQEMMTIKPTLKARYVKTVPIITKFLKSFMSGYSAEYDVAGVSDPFLQIHILHYFRIIAQGDLSLSDEVSDTLAQIATNTPSNKNSGNAVLFECVNAIMTIESSNTLKTLAINILGKFLNNKDANSRYVSLFSLQKLIQHDYDAVAKHKTIILDCLKESDLSIKKLALNLLYMITNTSNVKSIVKEMINHLLSSEPEFLEELTWKICSSVEKHSPSRRWHIDTMIKVLTLAGNYVSDESSSSLIHLITITGELQSYALFKLYFSFTENMNQEGLAKVTLWCIGELGTKLTTGQMEGPDNTPIKVTEEDIMSTIKKCLENANTTDVVKEYTVTCLAKLFTKFQSKKQEIKGLLESLTTSCSVEVQQRAIEFSRLCQSEWDLNRNAIMEPIPVLESVNQTYARKAIGEAENEEISNQEIEKALTKPTTDSKNDLLDLDDIVGPSEKKTPEGNSLNLLSDLISPGETKPMPQPGNQSANLLNLFDIDNSNTPGNPVQNNVQSQSQSNTDDLFQLGSSSTPVHQGEAFTAFEDQNTKLTFYCTRDSPDTVSIKNVITSKTAAELTEISFQAAVLKHLKLQLLPANGNSISGGKEVIQEMKIVNSMEGKKGIAMKIKFSYKVGGMPVNQEATISNFPSL